MQNIKISFMRSLSLFIKLQRTVEHFYVVSNSRWFLWDSNQQAGYQVNGVPMCLFLHDKKCPWFFMMVSLVLLKLHCVSKITSSHLCLQSIPHLDTKHYISPNCHPLLMPQIASASYRMAALCYIGPIGSFSFSASHSMYSQFIL